MKIHEYQAKEILRKYGVPVPNGEMVQTLEEADRAAKDLFDKGNPVVVVKAQIHAGGRGKGGGVKVVKSLGEGAKLITGDAPGLDLIVYGAVLVLVIGFAPRGLIGLLMGLRRRTKAAPVPTGSAGHG